MLIAIAVLKVLLPSDQNHATNANLAGSEEIPIDTLCSQGRFNTVPFFCFHSARGKFYGCSVALLVTRFSRDSVHSKAGAVLLQTDFFIGQPDRVFLCQGGRSCRVQGLLCVPKPGSLVPRPASLGAC